MTDFDSTEAFGRGGVALARCVLERVVPGSAVSDFQDDPAWRKAGVDLLWHVQRNAVATEVKYERSWTGNFALETLSIAQRRVPGWFFTTHAHVLLYGFADTGEWWTFDVPALRAALHGAVQQLRPAQAKTRVGSGSYTTALRLLPFDHPTTSRCVRRVGVFGRGVLQEDADGVGMLVRLGRSAPAVEVSQPTAGVRGAPVRDRGATLEVVQGRARVLLDKQGLSWHFPSHSCGLERAPCRICGGRRARAEAA
jgi:hypothetical protein